MENEKLESEIELCDSTAVLLGLRTGQYQVLSRGTFAVRAAESEQAANCINFGTPQKVKTTYPTGVLHHLEEEESVGQQRWSHSN